MQGKVEVKVQFLFKEGGVNAAVEIDADSEVHKINDVGAFAEASLEASKVGSCPFCRFASTGHQWQGWHGGARFQGHHQRSGTRGQSWGRN
jgi:hypothetical protein